MDDKEFILYGLKENLILFKSSIISSEAIAYPTRPPARERDLEKVCTIIKLDYYLINLYKTYFQSLHKLHLLLLPYLYSFEEFFQSLHDLKLIQ